MWVYDEIASGTCPETTMLASTELPGWTDTPLRAAMVLMSPGSTVFTSVQYHSPLAASAPSLPFQRGSRRSLQRLGRSCLRPRLVLLACTHTLMNSGAQPRCTGSAP